MRLVISALFAVTHKFHMKTKCDWGQEWTLSPRETIVFRNISKPTMFSCVKTDFCSPGPLSEQVKRCSGINSFVLRFFFFFLFFREGRGCTLNISWEPRASAVCEAPCSVSEEGTGPLSPLIKGFLKPLQHSWSARITSSAHKFLLWGLAETKSSLQCVGMFDPTTCNDSRAKGKLFQSK